MNNIYILNPAAGQGAALKYKSKDSSEIVHITQGIGDAENYVYECCLYNPRTRFIVYGGDGTINEVVNGIMNAKAGEFARISIVPVGTGNDFIRNFNTGEERTVDVMRYNGRYAVNIINIGFDCDVVDETIRIKKLPLVSGSMAYILGVVKVLFGSIGADLSVRFIDINNNEFHYEGVFLLAAIANGAYYGGGFHAAPLSSMQDGLLDVMIINKISRLKLVSLVGDYKKGLHMNSDTNRPTDKYNDIINFYRCKSLEIENLNKVCVDGEVLNVPSLKIEVIKQAITFIN